MAAYPFLKVWVKDFLGDNKVRAMTTEEIGAYFLLLLTAWHEDPPATLPNDDEVLARLTRLNQERWQAAKNRVLACFSVENGRLVQKRLRTEWEHSEAVSRGRAKAGRRGAEAKWQNDGKRMAIAIDPMAIATNLPCSLPSVTELCINSSLRDGGRGEGKSQAAELAALWDFLSTRKATTGNNWLAQWEAEFAELIRLGHEAKTIDAEIRDPSRSRSEWLSTFVERTIRNHGRHNGSGYGSVGRISGVVAPPGKYDGYGETVVCTGNFGVSKNPNGEVPAKPLPPG